MEREPFGGWIVYVVAVIVTGALLADTAVVVDNKLNIMGGVVDTCVANSQRLVQVTLVVLIQPESLDKAPKIDVKFTDPSGSATEEQFAVPESSLGGEVGFVYWVLKMPVPIKGRYVFAVSSDSGCVSLPLTITN
jgi:hypothetical protein